MKSKTIILTVNDYYKQYLAAGYPHNKVVVLENYGGVKKSDTRSIGKEYDIIWVGRFHRQKGLSDFIDIVNLVCEERPGTRVVLAGGGDRQLEEMVQRKIAAYGLQDNFILPGFVTGEQKYTYYAKSRLFVMTSYYESFGQVILEAASFGLAVVAYDLPVYGIFNDAITRCKLLDKEAMASSIVSLLADESKYLSKKDSASKLVSSHSWELTGDAILRAIHERLHAPTT